MATADKGMGSDQGHMDIRQNRDTYDAFIKFTVRGTLLVVVVLALMAIFLV